MAQTGVSLNLMTLSLFLRRSERYDAAWFGVTPSDVRSRVSLSHHVTCSHAVPCYAAMSRQVISD